MTKPITKIENFIHRKIIVLDQNSTVAQAARVMREKGIGSVMVADHQGQHLGIVTDRDLVIRVLGEGAEGAEGNDSQLPLSAVMTRDPLTVTEDADLEKVISLMQQKGVRRIPVIEEKVSGLKKCIGMVSLDDLIASKLITPDALMRVVRAQVLRRMRPFVPSGKAMEESRFFEIISDRVGQKIELSPGKIREITELVLSALVKRLHHTAALHLILQLPLSIQEELIELPAGPHFSITTARIVNDLVSQFGLDEATAYLVLTRICMALEEVIEPKHLEHVKAQLPSDLRALFASTAVRGP